MDITPQNIKEAILEDKKIVEKSLKPISNIGEQTLILQELAKLNSKYVELEEDFYTNKYIYPSKLCLEFISNINKSYKVSVDRLKKMKDSLYDNVMNTIIQDIKKNDCDSNIERDKVFFYLFASDNFKCFKDFFLIKIKQDNIKLNNIIEIIGSEDDDNLFCFIYGLNRYFLRCVDTSTFSTEKFTGTIYHHLTYIDNNTKDKSLLNFIKELHQQSGFNEDIRIINVREIV